MATAHLFLAHSQNRAGRAELLAHHLEAVARRAADYAHVLGASEEARIAGLLHDLGKYGSTFQDRLTGKARGVDHWSAGAWEALQRYKLQGVASAVAVQGHHIGLQQAYKTTLEGLDPRKLSEAHPLGLRLSEADTNLLFARLQEDGLESPRQLASSIYRCAPQQKRTAADMLDLRMLFSALVDADFIETEAHFNADELGNKVYRPPGPPLNAEQALLVLESYLQGLAEGLGTAEDVRRLRSDLLQACVDAAGAPRGLFTLTAPTGSGKTLSMLAFALKHAAKHGLRRVVTVIPYLTIIDQTVQEYRRALGALGDETFLRRFVLEDHSLAGTREPKDKAARGDVEDNPEYIHRLLAENWDAPIIVTTSVQFLESVFANRPAACRKLHRLANSVILFDEVQTLPIRLLIPTLATLSRLAERYGATIVFATATQPAFEHLHEAVKAHCVNGWKPREIVPPALNLFARAKRTEVTWPTETTPSSWDAIAEQIAEHQQVLCVVNLKRHALALLEKLDGEEGVRHLSTNMCSIHRERVLDDVRKRLLEQQPCRLISTQCVEAGVDLDFAVVFRAWGPLDAIAQAAGRCNRNGKLKSGTVHVFVPEDERLYPDGTYRQAASVAEMLLRRRGPQGMDINDPALFDAYYRELYDFAKPESTSPEIENAISRQDFQSVAKQYRVIDKNAINILVPYDPDAYEALAHEARERGLTGDWIRRARPHAVSIFQPHYDAPVRDYLEAVRVGKGGYSDEWFIYLVRDHYDLLRGLVPPESLDCLIA